MVGGHQGASRNVSGATAVRTGLQVTTEGMDCTEAVKKEKGLSGGWVSV